MNLRGSSRGGGAAHQVEPDHCLLGRLLWGHGGQSRARDMQTPKKNERRRGKSVWRESEQLVGFIKTKNLCPLRRGVGLYTATKCGYAAAYDSTLLCNRELDKGYAAV